MTTFQKLLEKIAFEGGSIEFVGDRMMSDTTKAVVVMKYYNQDDTADRTCLTPREKRKIMIPLVSFTPLDDLDLDKMSQGFLDALTRRNGK